MFVATSYLVEESLRFAVLLSRASFWTKDSIVTIDGATRSDFSANESDSGDNNLQPAPLAISQMDNNVLSRTMARRMLRVTDIRVNAPTLGGSYLSSSAGPTVLADTDRLCHA